VGGVCAGVITAVGGTVPTKLDMFAGWFVKCLPLFHGYQLRVTTPISLGMRVLKEWGC
jgi:hypothetical protein